MKILSTEAEVLLANVNKVFGDLVGHGFKFRPPSVKHTDAIGDYLEIEATSASTGKTLSVTYAPALDLRPESISVFIQNISGDAFSIGDYLSSNKLSPQLRQSICLANHQGSFNQRVEETLFAIRGIIFNHLQHVLFGDGWECVPINWGDLK